MSHIDYSDDGKPEITSQMFSDAKFLGMFILQIICHNDTGEDHVNFLTLCNYVPRIGETISLEDGTKCKVTDVLNKVKTHTTCSILHHCLIAQIIQGEQ